MLRNPWFDPAALKRARTSAGFSQTALATVLGISNHTVKAWEAGRRTPTPRNLDDAARLLGVEPTTLNSQRDPGQLDLQGLRESAGLSVRAAADRLRTDPKTLRRV